MNWLDTINQMKKEKGMTTDDISNLSGIPKGTLNKLFAGQTKDPQLSTIKAVVHCLGYTLDDLDKKKSPISEKPIMEDTVEKKVQYLTDFFISCGFIKEGGDISDSDLKFSISLISLIDSYFNK